MGLGLQGGLYRLLLLLHILCATVGFGAVVFNGLYRQRARQQGGEAELILLEENDYITRVAEYLIYGVLVFGLLTSLTSQNYWELSQSWLSAAMLLYIIELGLLHGVVHRTERDYHALLRQVNGGGAAAAEGGDKDVTELERMEKRIRLGWVGFDVIFLVILYLMVLTPGHVRTA